MTLGAVSRTLAMLCAVFLVGACEQVGRGAEPETTVRDGVRQVRLDQPKTVEVDGRRVATRCGGNTRDPTVVLVSGFDTTMADAWDSVQASIGAFAHVCAYDRLGVGGSGKPPRSQTFSDMARTLDEVISQLDLKRPVVLVAHSLGGMVAASWAAEHTKDLRGLLMVDATGPSYPQRLLDLLPRRGGSAGAQLRDGIQDLLEPRDNAERLDGRAAFDEVGSLPAIGDVPMTVLSHTIIELGDVRPQQAADIESFWEEGQHKWLTLSSQARFERVDLAGHFIQNDQPEVVVDFVRELVGG